MPDMPFVLEDKTAEKQYLAILEGDVDWREVPRRFRAEIDQIDGERKKKRKRQSGAGVQYKNASSFFQEHQQALKRRQTSGEELSASELRLLGAKWKEVKRSQDKADKEHFERCEALAEADKLRVIAAAEEAEEPTSEPPAGGLGVWRWENVEGCGQVVIDAPIAEVPGDFKMQIGTEAATSPRVS